MMQTFIHEPVGLLLDAISCLRLAVERLLHLTLGLAKEVGHVELSSRDSFRIDVSLGQSKFGSYCK